jgi:hypothetical protein|tara:strand:+ start:400 stop:507 length:108 start_codon:yes stop_codon:yes gene_type:complete
MQILLKISQPTTENMAETSFFSEIMAEATDDFLGP